MMIKRYTLIILPVILMLSACAGTSMPPSASTRPMDEVPTQVTLASGDRQYGFRNGCVIVLEPKRAVVKTEGRTCVLHHRDIALLYASGD
ncbi:hypothetical protein GB928_015715 [Shinella curvata]|uniref:Uncharacterized protein n=1 Tax=Shinella curvata TaxID=1817964 RepID=A0ABT8XFX9_9HYPH|nr:hypothetical protein [Shinella curvata]MCJ8053308.1 hypothetical protein [Shinella curvata]MDO6122639.1 hypothetical protein [Shinella curvata]